MSPRSLKIGFISVQDPQDRRSWSGAMYYMFHALKQHAGDVEHLPLTRTRTLRLVTRIVAKTRRIFGDHADLTQSVPMSIAYGRHYRKSIARSKCDVIFAPIAATEIGYLRSPVPVVYFSDATFQAMENYYYAHTQMHPLTRWEGNHLEKRAIHRSAAVIYTSQWAARSAVEDYGADPAKIKIIPFGANVETVHPDATLHRSSTDGKCRLLFVGRDWKRKGGQLAYDAFLALQARGIDAELTIIGCTPEPAASHPQLCVIPFLNKNIPEERAALENHYRNADIFLLPTRAECVAIVFCEASAYGVPIVATDTGGVSSVVVEGVNGLLLPPEADADAYAETVAQLWQDPARYQKMRQTSRARYDAALNWTTWAVAMRALMEQLVSK